MRKSGHQNRISSWKLFEHLKKHLLGKSLHNFKLNWSRWQVPLNVYLRQLIRLYYIVY